MKLSSWVCLGFLAMVQPLWANGGGFFRGGVERAGDVAGFEPQETEKIRILDEKLTVALGKESAEVEVRYLMRNEADKKVKVRFGFPVEESARLLRGFFCLTGWRYQKELGEKLA